MEMLTLLVWRHVAFYAEGRHVNNPELKGPLAHALRLASAPSVEQFRSELERRMVAVIALLRMLEIVSPSAPFSIQRPES